MALLLTSLAFLLVLASSAYATTLEITSGNAQFGAAGTTSESIFLSISGDDFTAFHIDMVHGTGGSPTVTLSFANFFDGFNIGSVVVHGDTCSYLSPTVGFVNCGFISIVAAQPIAPPPPDLQGPFVTPPVPFTATGHLNVGSGYDIVGQGEVVGIYCSVMLNGSCVPPTRSVPALAYGFSAAVPEPSTLPLLVTGLGLMACAWRRR
jgi:hypothetical protein